MLWQHYDWNWGISAIKNNRLLAIFIEFKRKQVHPSKVQYYNVLKILKPECPTPFAALHSGEHNLITYCLGEQKQIIISRPHTALLTQQPSVHSVRDNLPGCSIAPYRERHIICIVLVLKNRHTAQSDMQVISKKKKNPKSLYHTFNTYVLK